jgi:hypothetical protein
MRTALQLKREKEREEGEERFKNDRGMHGVKIL